MMNNTIGKRIPTFLLSGLALLTFSCSDDSEDLNPDGSQNVSSTEVKTILETDQFSSAADDIITDLFQDGSSGKTSENEDCYATEYSNTGFTVNFDDCTVEEGGETLNGMLSVTYLEGEESTAFTATYSNLNVDGIIVNGTRSFTMNTDSQTENVSFTIVSNMSITLADETVVEESGTKTFAILLDFENFANSAVTIDGTWTVKADGNTYVVNVTSDLTANFSCDYIGSGAMSLAKNGLKVDVDFGDGSCDDKANLTYPDGTIEEISLND